jgi:hypothetical protein
LRPNFFQTLGILDLRCNKRELGFLSLVPCVIFKWWKDGEEETAHRVVGGGKWMCHVMIQRIPGVTTRISVVFSKRRRGEV